MINTIDAKIHHLKELDFIERELYGVFSPNKFYRDLSAFLRDNPDIDLKSKAFLHEREVLAVDDFIKHYFHGHIEEAKIWYLRAYVIGRYLGESDKIGKIFQIGQISGLPAFVKQVAKQFDLSLQEAKMIESSLNQAGMFITHTTQGTVYKVQSAIIESLIQRQGAQGVEQRLRSMLTDDIGELNRDWKRVAITEVNKLFNDGYLDTLDSDDYVIGISMPDACDHCLRDINSKIYQVIKTPPPDYTNMTGEERKRVEKLWETKVWSGKNNIGRSASKQKRHNPKLGNKKENLRDKHHHEMTMPAVPYHPYCRCRYIYFNPKYNWVDENGNLRLSVEDLEKHARWVKDNIQ